ncbi:hypothetical protein L1887_34910 [Cichorium endivia]|nr:hypothetical protein L1887_34910 [Cichorium endivia]
MEGIISLRQNHDNKENIPPFFSIDNKLSAKMTLKKKKNTYRKPLNDITNLIVDSLVKSQGTSFLSPHLQSRSICRSTAGFIADLARKKNKTVLMRMSDLLKRVDHSVDVTFCNFIDMIVSTMYNILISLI